MTDQTEPKTSHPLREPVAPGPRSIVSERRSAAPTVDAQAAETELVIEDAPRRQNVRDCREPFISLRAENYIASMAELSIAARRAFRVFRPLFDLPLFAIPEDPWTRDPEGRPHRA